MEKHTRATAMNLNRDQTSLFRLAVQRATDGIIWTNSDGQIVYANQSACDLLNQNELELVSQSIAEVGIRLVNHSTNPTWMQLHEQLKKSNGQPVEYNLSQTNGETLSIDLSASFAQLDGDEFCSIFVRNISRQKQSEADLKQQNEDYKIIFDAVPAMIWYKDTSNKMLRVNKTAATAMGKDALELEGRNTRDFYPNAEDYYKDDLEVIRSNTPKLGIVEPMVDQFGSKAWVQTDKIPHRNEKGDVNGVIVIARDITAQKEAEEALKSTANELEQFAYIASHDLQEPLRMITSYIELLQLESEDNPESKTAEYMKYILDGAFRMRKMIRDLLQYAKIGRVPESWEDVDCYQVVLDVEKNLNVSIKSSEAFIEKDDLPVIRGTHTALVQLFQNLIENAIKYRSEAKPWIRILCRKGMGEWLFSVEDNGIGIPEHHLKKIFNLFQRASRHDNEGSGIGLAIAKKIVDGMKGRIWVNSEPGKGSIFCFTIPIKEKT
ncbi:MAG: sensory transduction histidine kinase [Bacteriovoracaceae bacterium]|nr:sensory transduction histidine kinase [Bacteriovoracaceae bacterium]